MSEGEDAAWRIQPRQMAKASVVEVAREGLGEGMGKMS